MNFPYITSDPEILGGKPIIKNTRISVEFILELVASGNTCSRGNAIPTFGEKNFH